MSACPANLESSHSPVRIDATIDAQLVARHLNGDDRAFTQLAGRYHVKLCRFIQRMIGDRERAEDLAQETFLRIYRHLPRFDSSRSFSTWAYAIAANLARNELRNRSRSPLRFPESSGTGDDSRARSMDFEDISTRPDTMFRRRQLRRLVDDTVARLAPVYREVFVRRELQGQSYQEIALATRCTLGTVKSRLNRARAGFADMIAPLLD